MVGPDVEGVQKPVAMDADLAYRPIDALTLPDVERIRV
jgi:hypothetical protein